MSTKRLRSSRTKPVGFLLRLKQALLGSLTKRQGFFAQLPQASAHDRQRRVQLMGQLIEEVALLAQGFFLRRQITGQQQEIAIARLGNAAPLQLLQLLANAINPLTIPALEPLQGMLCSLLLRWATPLLLVNGCSNCSSRRPTSMIAKPLVHKSAAA